MHNLDYFADKLVRVGDDTFRFGVPPQPTPDDRTPPVFKSRILLDQLAQVVHRLEPTHIDEFGIYRGGSVALLAAMAEPRKQVAFELTPEREAPLDDFLRERQLDETVVAEYGVDQGSPDVIRILDREFGDSAIDLVIDDASHLYGPSRRSLEMVFPRVRPGGVYIIEDWAAEHTLVAAMVEAVVRRSGNWEVYLEQISAGLEEHDSGAAAALRDDPTTARVHAAARTLASHGGLRPLSRLVLELVHLSAESVDVIRSVRVSQGWIEIERGTAELRDDAWLDRGSIDLFGSLIR